MRNIALGRGSTTRPSTSMAPSFFAMTSVIPCLPARRSLSPGYKTWAEEDLFQTGHARAGAGAAPLPNDTRSGERTKIADRLILYQPINDDQPAGVAPYRRSYIGQPR